MPSHNVANTGSKVDWTVRSALVWLAGYFQQKHITDYQLEAEQLLSVALKTERMQLFLTLDRFLSTEEKKRLRSLVEKRVKGFPIAYLQGESYFWTFSLKVHTGVLIPRKETEILVETLIAYWQKHWAQLSGVDRDYQILDIGTGTGAIALALATEIPACRVLGVDISEESVVLAQANYQRLADTGVTFFNPPKFIVSDLFNAVPNQKFDVIVSNPPYISATEYANLPKEVHQEPKTSLVAQDDGLFYFRQILTLAKEHLVLGGIVAFEHGYQQKKALLSLADEIGGWKLIEARQDLSHQDRVLVFQAAG